jgi:hypothetical protein
MCRECSTKRLILGGRHNVFIYQLLGTLWHLVPRFWLEKYLIGWYNENVDSNFTCFFPENSTGKIPFNALSKVENRQWHWHHL